MGIRAIGSSAIVRFTEEEVWGVMKATPTKVFGVNLRNESLASTKTLFSSQAITNHRTVVGLGNGNFAVAGNISMDFLPEGQEIFWLHLLGDLAPTHVGSGPVFIHTMKGRPTFKQGITIEKDFLGMGGNGVDQFFNYTGCRVNTMTLNIIQQGFHDITFDFVGKTELEGNYNASSPTAGQMAMSPVAVFPSKSGYTGYECKVFVAVYGASYGAELGNVTQGSMSIANNVDANGYVLGSPYRASAVYGLRNSTGSFTTFFEDASLYAKYLSGADCKLKFVFDNSSAGGAELFAIEFPRVKLAGNAPKIANAQGIDMPLTFSAQYDIAEDTDVKIQIQNALPTFGEIAY